MADAAATERFEAHLGLARGVARTLSARWYGTYSHDELYAMALVGLWDCARAYVDDGRAKFRTYAQRHVPLRVIDQIRTERGRLHTNGDTKNDLAKMQAWYPGTMPPVDLGDSVVDFVELVGAEEDSGYAEVEVEEVVEQWLAGLKPRTRRMVRLRLEGLHYAEIGERMGVTESRVCQLMTKARPRLERLLLGVSSRA